MHQALVRALSPATTCRESAIPRSPAARPRTSNRFDRCVVWVKCWSNLLRLARCMSSSNWRLPASCSSRLRPSCPTRDRQRADSLRPRARPRWHGTAWPQSRFQRPSLRSENGLALIDVASREYDDICPGECIDFLLPGHEPAVLEPSAFRKRLQLCFEHLPGLREIEAWWIIMATHELTAETNLYVRAGRIASRVPSKSSRYPLETMRLERYSTRSGPFSRVAAVRSRRSGRDASPSVRLQLPTVVHLAPTKSKSFLRLSERTMIALTLRNVARIRSENGTRRTVEGAIDDYVFDLRMGLFVRALHAESGIGPIIASAYVATVGDPVHYRNGRQLAASLGLVPRQHSTGGKPVLLGISKRGDRYLRTQLIHGARAVLRHVAGKPTP